MSTNINILLSSIFSTMKSAKDKLAEVGDLVIDIATDKSALNSVPVISTAVKVLEIKDAFVHHKFKRNVAAFLSAVSEADEKLIEDLHDQFKSDANYANDFTDTIISVLIEGEKPLKSELIGKLVISLAKKKITKEEFEALSQLVQSAAIPTLRALPRFMHSTGGKPYKRAIGQLPEEPLLYPLGIAYRFGTHFRVSDLGGKLYAYGFGGEISNEAEIHEEDHGDSVDK